MAKVCSKVLPGGNETLTCVCDKSSGGMKPVGKNFTKNSEPPMNNAAAMMVMRRCFKHHAAQRM